MKLQKGDKVELKKDFDHLVQGLTGKVLQTEGSGALIQFNSQYEAYFFTADQIQEYLSLRLI